MGGDVCLEPNARRTTGLASNAEASALWCLMCSQKTKTDSFPDTSGWGRTGLGFRPPGDPAGEVAVVSMRHLRMDSYGGWGPLVQRGQCKGAMQSVALPGTPVRWQGHAQGPACAASCLLFGLCLGGDFWQVKGPALFPTHQRCPSVQPGSALGVRGAGSMLSLVSTSYRGWGAGTLLPGGRS